MKFAMIAPTVVLKECAIGREVQFCLAQHCGNKEYLGFFKEAVERGEHVILDNGAWEEKMVSFGSLWDIIQELKPTVAVVPDMIGIPGWSEYLRTSWLDFVETKGLRPNEEIPYLPAWMYPVHGGDIWEEIEEYLKLPDDGWVGLPRKMSSRVDFVSRLKQLRQWKGNRKHHALGMAGGDLGEAKLLAKLGVYSIDSSNPVWRKGLGMAGHLQVGVTTQEFKYGRQRSVREAVAEVDNTIKGGK